MGNHSKRLLGRPTVHLMEHLLGYHSEEQQVKGHLRIFCLDYHRMKLGILLGSRDDRSKGPPVGLSNENKLGMER